MGRNLYLRGRKLQNEARFSQSIIPLDLLRAALRRWWVVVLGMVIGGALGFLAHAFLPPLYQAESVITVNIDFSRTGPLTDVEEDFIYLVVGGAIESDEIVNLAVDRARANGFELDRVEFDRFADLQRRFTDWLLIIRHPDPAVAAGLAQAWGDAAWNRLQEAYEHTLAAEQLQRYLDAQVSCLEAAESQQPATACSLGTVDEIQAEIDAATARLQEEKEAALGMVPGTMLLYTAQAQTPSTPVLRARSALVLAGAFIGMLLGGGILFVRPGISDKRGQAKPA